MTEQPIWEQREDEKPRYWAAFLAYREQGRGGGKRSLEGLINQWLSSGVREKPPTSSYKTLLAWSSKFNWTERVNAYDQHVIAEQQADLKAHRENRREVWGKRHEEALEEINATMMELREYTRAVRTRIGRVEIDGKEVDAIISKSTAHEIRSMVAAHTEFMKLVALWLGDPTEITEHRHDVDNLLKRVQDAAKLLRDTDSSDAG